MEVERYIDDTSDDEERLRDRIKCDVERARSLAAYQERKQLKRLNEIAASINLDSAGRRVGIGQDQSRKKKKKTKAAAPSDKLSLRSMIEGGKTWVTVCDSRGDRKEWKMRPVQHPLNEERHRTAIDKPSDRASDDSWWKDGEDDDGFEAIEWSDDCMEVSSASLWKGVDDVIAALQAKKASAAHEAKSGTTTSTSTVTMSASTVTQGMTKTKPDASTALVRPKHMHVGAPLAPMLNESTATDTPPKPHGTEGKENIEPSRQGTARTSEVDEIAGGANRASLIRVRWPSSILHLRSHFNPKGLVFPRMPTFGYCSCVTPCRRHSCRNAELDIFCAPNVCMYGGLCGNGLGLVESSKLRVAKSPLGIGLSVVATLDIDQGVVLGEYVGELLLEGASTITAAFNTGYRMSMTARAEGSPRGRVFIDGRRYGNITRFMNHACNAPAEFRKVSNGRDQTVVAVTTDSIQAGQEVTVKYGKPWFSCRCGAPNCISNK